MISPKITEVEDRFGNIYDVVILAAQRAKEIQQGSPPLIKTNSVHPLTIALEEIAAGVYPPSSEEAEASQEEEGQEQEGPPAQEKTIETV